MGWVILAAGVICVWWLVAHGLPWAESKGRALMDWSRTGRDIDRTVAQEAPELHEWVERVLREEAE